MIRAGLLLLGLAACSSKSGDPPAPAAADGAAVYKMACVRCHGARGEGDGAEAKLIGGAPRIDRAMPAEYVRVTVERGRGAMPAHADRLSPADIEAVVGYVGSLAR